VAFTHNLDLPIAESIRPAPKSALKRETAEMCRERAAADLLASVAALTAHQRERMALSAAAWTARAEMLQRVEDGTAERLSELGADFPGLRL
jgi:hypothetical protein